MAKPRSRDSGRFRIYVSDRSGFEFGFQPITSGPNAYDRESGKPVQDKNLKVSPTEFDSPPPSNIPLGGEGDISGSPAANSNFDTPSNAFIEPAKIIVSVNSSNSISWNQNPWVYISGALQNQTMAVNPQVVAGQESQQITLFCVGSNVTLINGSGLTLRNSRFAMSSGAILTLMYHTNNSTWFETSRSVLYGDLGLF